MKTSLNQVNPFVLMMDPESVLCAMESSTDLRRLRHRVCRPLDKPLIPKTHGRFAAQALEFDAVIDAEEFMDTGSELYTEAQPALQAVH